MSFPSKRTINSRSLVTTDVETLQDLVEIDVICASGVTFSVNDVYRGAQGRKRSHDKAECARSPLFEPADPLPADSDLRGEFRLTETARMS